MRAHVSVRPRRLSATRAAVARLAVWSWKWPLRRSSKKWRRLIAIERKRDLVPGDLVFAQQRDLERLLAGAEVEVEQAGAVE